MISLAASRRSSIALAALILGLGLAVARPTFAQNPNPGVFPLQSQPHGLSYGEWSAKWWQWALAIPAATNPLLDNTGANCAVGQSGQVWFLAGTFGGTATRACTVPTGRALFIPILNVVFGAGVFDCDPTNPGVPCVVSDLRAAAAAAMDNPMQLAVSVDGVSLQNLSSYRVTSPVFSLTFPAGAVLPVPAGTYQPNVADGYYLMLAPLPRGSHTTYIKGVANNGFTSEVTYHLTVE